MLFHSSYTTKAYKDSYGNPTLLTGCLAVAGGLIDRSSCLPAGFFKVEAKNRSRHGRPYPVSARNVIAGLGGAEHTEEAQFFFSSFLTKTSLQVNVEVQVLVLAIFDKKKQRHLQYFHSRLFCIKIR